MQTLKVLVIGMGILILVAMAVIAVTIYKRAMAPDEETAVTDTSIPIFGTVGLPVPQSANVEEMVADDGRLTLRLRLSDGSTRIIVVDLASGTLLGTFLLQPAP